jgi:SAM-dependent methyltransferase
MSEHDRDLESAFDGQAARFERAPVQSDPAALRWLVAVADLPPDSLVLDSGCGPGLVSKALLEAGHRVVGVDLSSEMIARAGVRCAEYGDRARFVQTTVYDPNLSGSFDAAISRYVLHHVTEPARFIARQVELLRPDGILVLSDHTTDPDPERAALHLELEVGRDRTHTRNHTPGELLDLFASAGLVGLRLVEEAFTLDFDEWFDRGTPAATKSSVRERLVAGPPIRGFRAAPLADGSVRIYGERAIVRGIKPASPAHEEIEGRGKDD